MKTSKIIHKEFKEHLIKENSKRFLILLYLLVFSQILFFVLELTRIMKWEKDIFVCRIIVIVICIVSIGLILLFSKKKSSEKPLPILGIIILIIQLITITTGAYFVVYIYNTGTYSFSAFLLVAFIVSLTYVSNPYYSGIVLLVFFAGLGIYINIFIIGISSWIGEFLIAAVFIILICIGNVLNYKRHLRMFTQDKEILEANEKLKEISQVDALTNIYNRRKLVEVLEEHIEISKRYKTFFCVTMIDIDNFKRINDKYGHVVGDNTLREFSDVLAKELRVTDVLGRWGGEEFIIITHYGEEEDAFKLIERLRKKIENTEFEEIEKLTFSAGICTYMDEKNYSELIEKADFAMYMAKNSGRNQTKTYPPKNKSK